MGDDNVRRFIGMPADRPKPDGIDCPRPQGTACASPDCHVNGCALLRNPLNETVPENFADAPQSITELRAEKNGYKYGDLTPRDALIRMLRFIDSGQEKPTALMVVWYAPDEPKSTTGTVGVSIAGPNFLTALGMLHRADTIMQEK